MLEELSQDILDVGMNAAQAGARLLKVRVTENGAKDTLTIILADNGRGMSPELRAQVLLCFRTTKNNHNKNLGLGIALLRQAAEECDGRFHLFTREGMGSIIAVQMRRSHIDRPPLGDMAASIAALCCTTGAMRVHYEHRCENKKIVFNSGELFDSDLDLNALSAKEMIAIETILNEGEMEIRKVCPDTIAA